jgi:hypothetical protein
MNMLTQCKNKAKLLFSSILIFLPQVRICIPMVTKGLMFISIAEKGYLSWFLGMCPGLGSKVVESVGLHHTDIVNINISKSHEALLVKIITISYQEGIKALLEQVDNFSPL